MKTIINIIATNPYPIAIGWAATMIGLAVAIITPILQKKRKVLYYTLNTVSIVDPHEFKLPNLLVKFESRDIDQLSVTQIQIWNAGNTNIDSQDMFPDHELFVKNKYKSSTVFLFSEVSFQSSDTIQCCCECKEDGIKIIFQTFERGDTVVINAYHTGKRSTPLILDGKIREGDIFEKGRRLRFDWPGTNIISWVLSMIFMAITLFLIVHKRSLDSTVVVLVFIAFLYNTVVNHFYDRK